MKPALRALWTLAAQLFLGVIGQPLPGQTPADRARQLQKTRRMQNGTGRTGAFAALRTLAREALYAATFQPSPEAGSERRSASSRRRPRP